MLLGWNVEERKEPRYDVHLPSDLGLSRHDVLVLSLADAKQDPSPADPEKEKRDEKNEQQREPIDLTVEVTDQTGETARLQLSSFGRLQPQIEVQVLKAAFLSDVPSSEVVFQSFELPLSGFLAANPKLSPQRASSVRLLFDRTPKGVVWLDNLGFYRTSANLPR